MMKDTASVTRLGDFWQLMVTNFVRKVAQISCLVLGYFEKHHFLIKTDIATFWRVWAAFYYNICSHWTQLGNVSQFIQNIQIFNRRCGSTLIVGPKIHWTRRFAKNYEFTYKEQISRIFIICIRIWFCVFIHGSSLDVVRLGMLVRESICEWLFSSFCVRWILGPTFLNKGQSRPLLSVLLFLFSTCHNLNSNLCMIKA